MSDPNRVSVTALSQQLPLRLIEPRKPIDAARLQALTASMPPRTETAADLVRAMREDERY